MISGADGLPRSLVRRNPLINGHLAQATNTPERDLEPGPRERR
jgi:hypothetical protein